MEDFLESLNRALILLDKTKQKLMGCVYTAENRLNTTIVTFFELLDALRKKHMAIRERCKIDEKMAQERDNLAIESDLSDDY